MFAGVFSQVRYVKTGTYKEVVLWLGQSNAKGSASCNIGTAYPDPNPNIQVFQATSFATISTALKTHQFPKESMRSTSYAKRLRSSPIYTNGYASGKNCT